MKEFYKLTILIALAGTTALRANVALTQFLQIEETIFEGGQFDWRACYNGAGFCAGNGFVSTGNVTSSSGASVKVTGTTDTTGTLPSAQENLTMMDSAPAEFATANGSANLSTGIVRIQNTAGPFGSPENAFPESFTHIDLTDNVHFNVTNPSPSGTPIQVKFTLDGTMSCPITKGDLPGDNAAYIDAALNFGGFVNATIDCDFNTAPFLSTYPGANGESGWMPGNYLSNTPQLIQFAGTFDLHGSSPTVPFSLIMNAFATDGASVDYSHTAQIRLVVPNGVTFTSDSGSFLTASPNAVPEPSTWPVLSGLAALVLVRRLLRS